MDYLKELNPEQLEAATTTEGYIRVVAGAGSGKTKVLVDRLLGRICDSNDPCNIDDFLVITYTKSAAAELRVNISQAVSLKI